MKIKIKNKELANVEQFLGNLTMKGKQSIARSRMLQILEKKQKEFAEDRKSIVIAYAEKDDKGEAIVKEDGTYELSTKGNAEASKEIADLLEEDAVIDYGEYSSRLNDLEKFIIEFDDEVSGNVAQGFFVLTTAFENKEV
ncbi:DUF1617 family protein [Enterococcus sp. SMC-9]|uniref:DUF1617 family protein n=1 Tax=Enterococcus sp. SMC-9 TaxID=2862343 RepID=UPI001E4FB285|nr:DUF1617 family protein [Enterococcus sp. SMC-9]MCD1023460.1 DUF1617 family protein [Enterococcus sp. SMC-9]